MCSKGLLHLFLLLAAAIGLSSCQNQYERMPVIPPPRPQQLAPEIVNNNIDRGSAYGPGGGGGGFMQTAKSFVASPTGQLAVSMAKEFISRSAGGNQVLSLNLTSLLILVLLKALIFATGLLGAGNWSQYGRGRALDNSELRSRDWKLQSLIFHLSLNQDSIVDNAEMQLFLGFLAAEGSKNDGCLYRAVCLSPEQGSEYLKAGKALLQGFGVFDP